MVRWLVLLLLVASPVFPTAVWAQQQGAKSPATLALPTGPAIIGPLELDAQPAADGRSVLVEVRLQNVIVGAQTLTAPFPIYAFSVIVGTTSASGTFTALFMPPDQVSTVMAAIAVEVAGQPKQQFTGLVMAFVVPSH